ncbi:MAG TPA: hypothetical protein VM910_23015, partial [Bradyrhizobium sp.]|nr:hypothetical protein [Bradyrhizobium sp.]
GQRVALGGGRKFERLERTNALTQFVTDMQGRVESLSRVGLGGKGPVLNPELVVAQYLAGSQRRFDFGPNPPISIRFAARSDPVDFTS